MHKQPHYYPIRNHLVDFLVSRSRTFHAERKDFDNRHVPIVRPAMPEPTLIRGAEQPPPTRLVGTQSIVQ